jgi:hypothetical protein
MLDSEDVTMATTCPRCESAGRLQEIAVMLTRWTASGTQTTLRCPRCGFQDTRPDQALGATAR